MPSPLFVSKEVEQALEQARPVVALESSLISQGLPRPCNLEIALRSEALLRREGVTPATVAILDGRAHVGLSEQQIERLAEHDEIAKVNLCNLPALLAKSESGACTVAGTLWPASKAGVRVMATGGIGGVHRDVAHSMDISSDLTALARYPMVVVSAGIKSVLALAETLEVLETLGVPVVGWKTSELPAFYCRASGCRLEMRVDSAEEVAAIERNAHAMGYPGAILVMNPIPVEDEIPRVEIEPWIEQALQTATESGVRGKALTPFLLSRLEQLSGRRTLEANLALIENNVRRAAEIAKCVSKNIGQG